MFHAVLISRRVEILTLSLSVIKHNPNCIRKRTVLSKTISRFDQVKENLQIIQTSEMKPTGPILETEFK